MCLKWRCDGEYTRGLREQMYPVEPPGFGECDGGVVFVAAEEEGCARCAVRRFYLDPPLAPRRIKRQNVVTGTIAFQFGNPPNLGGQVGAICAD